MENNEQTPNQEESPVTQPAAGGFASFKHEDITYGIMFPATIFKGKKYTAQEIAAAENEKLQADLVALAWEGPDGKREENEFDRNGLLKIFY